MTLIQEGHGKRRRVFTWREERKDMHRKTRDYTCSPEMGIAQRILCIVGTWSRQIQSTRSGRERMMVIEVKSCCLYEQARHLLTV